jgi:ribA/ribD-fused uncharacterized protein
MSNENDLIYFRGGGYNCLSNFAAFQVAYNDTTWMTAEHAYQAAKFDDQAIQAKIKHAPSPYRAKLISQQHESKVRNDWHDINVELMKDILTAKLNQHEYVRKKLQKSKGRKLVEDTDDEFWGRGPDGDSTNKLGKLWMELREEL